MAQSYEKAGVNLEAGYEVVRRIKKHVASTSRLGVMGNIGAFGGMFDLSALNVKEPVLVSGTDGVGTKLKLAFEMDKHDTIGIDAVAMCVNDVLAQGAEPLLFLDYVAVGHNEPQKIEAIVAGVAEGCRQAGCALVGGETAEMPGMYAEGEYDIAGFTVGVVEKSKLIDGSKVQVGDVLVGVASSGVHSNGFSLVRKILADNFLDLHRSYPELSNKLLGEVLLTPTKIYVQQVLDVIRNCDVHGISHITGGGFDENIPRILHDGQGLEIEEGSWEILPVFRFLEKYGKVPHREMFNIFNMGIGMVIALDASEAQRAIDILTARGEGFGDRPRDRHRRGRNPVARCDGLRFSPAATAPTSRRSPGPAGRACWLPRWCCWSATAPEPASSAVRRSSAFRPSSSTRRRTARRRSTSGRSCSGSRRLGRSWSVWPDTCASSGRRCWGPAAGGSSISIPRCCPPSAGRTPSGRPSTTGSRSSV